VKPITQASMAFLVLALAGFSLQGPGAAPPVPVPVELQPNRQAVTAVTLSLDPLPTPTRPAPLRVALQAGHWRASEAPDELSGLRRNGGTSGGGKYEWEVNLEIAELTRALLEEAGYAVDVLPATVPQGYQADAFIAIHADGNNDASVDGYRVGWPRRDRTLRAAELADRVAAAYGEATGMRRLPVATRRMRGYYAFRYNRYRHGILDERTGPTDPARRSGPSCTGDLRRCHSVPGARESSNRTQPGRAKRVGRDRRTPIQCPFGAKRPPGR
jgi:hypothetical protein